MRRFLIIMTLVLSCTFLIAQADSTDMSRFYDTQEIEAELSEISETYPNYTKLTNLKTTFTDSLPIWAIKLSDNADIDEDEPAILFVGTCHAEEVMGTELVMDNIYEILEFNDVAPFSNWLQDLEMWFVPTMNPEGMRVVHGFEENGEWVQKVTYRKNRTDNNNNGIFDYEPDVLGYDIDGVDPNRNYPFNWVHGDTLYHLGGETEAYDYYRGPSPLSEAGSIAIDELVNEQNIVYSIHWHSSRSGNLSEKLYYPFNWYQCRPSPDLEMSTYLGQNIAGQIVKESGTGTYEPYASQGRKGNEHDYLYKKYGTFQFLIEAGTENIQPDTSLMQDQIERTKQGVYWLLNRALPYQYGSNVEDHSMLTGHILDAETGQPLEAEIIIEEHDAEYLTPRMSESNYGRFWRPLLPGSYTLTIRKPGYIPVSYPGIIVNSSAWTSFEIELNPADEFQYEINLTDENMNPINAKIYRKYLGQKYEHEVNNGNINLGLYEGEHDIVIYAEGYYPYESTWNVEDTNKLIDITLSSGNSLFSDDFNEDLVNWSIDGEWELIEEIAYEGQAITDSWGGKGFYQMGSDVNITTSESIEIPSDTGCYLTFMSHRYTEFKHDSTMVQVSTDQNNWTTLWKKTGRYDYWKREYVNLSAWSGQTVYIRFRLKDNSSHVGLVDPGWTIDNVEIVAGYNDYTDTEEITEEVPQTLIKLNKNYPNPFNPETSFTFQIKNTKIDHAQIKIFNIKGQVVEKLKLNQEQIRNGKITWNAKNNSSGVYFYRLTVDGKNYGTQKALLIK